MIHAFRTARAAAVLIAAGLALSTCATLDEEECLSTDWQTLGQQDGAAGRPSNYIERHQEACAKHKLPVGDQSWNIGWQTGIRLYCTPENGLTVGRSGQGYANSCPVDLAPRFTSAYDVGKRVYDARQAVESNRRELDEAIASLAKGDQIEKKDRRIRVETLRTRQLGAELRLQSAESTYDRYVLGLQRGF